jgi:hypothetical protein
VVSKLIFKNGEIYFLKYVSERKDEMDIYPFQYGNYDQMNFLENGIYTLIDGRKILVEDKKIMKFI